ncbi:MAG: ABC transporter permease [Clostridiales bacterium]|nr:ABC transporter permease [Clostridiales bacterium]
MRKRVFIRWQDIVPFIAFAAIFIFFSVTSGGKMLSAFNLKMLLDQSMVVVLMGCGMLFVVAQGSIDLSVGVNLALSGVFGVWFGFATGVIWLMIPAALVCGLAVGLLNGFLVSKLKVPSFMLTIAMLIGVRGIVNYIQQYIGTQMLPTSLAFLNQPPVKIPLFIVIVVIMVYLFEFTKIGRYSRAIGENETAAEYVGIPVSKIKIIAFALSGLMAGVGAFFAVIGVGGTSQTMGVFMEMKVAMAVFLGGVLVTGGASAKIYKVLLGSFSITIIVNGLALIGHPESQISESVEGILLLLILLATIFATRRDRQSGRMLPEGKNSGSLEFAEQKNRKADGKSV